MTQDAFQSRNPHRLYRNPAKGKLAGVCAGIADYFSVNVCAVRFATIMGLIFFFVPTAIAYIVLALALHVKPAHQYESKEEEVFWRSVAIKPDQTLSSLRAKFRDLDHQIAGMEGFVASREYNLRREFKDLEK